jgi:beta-lactamase family protein/polyglycine hydrolase-like protein
MRFNTLRVVAALTALLMAMTACTDMAGPETDADQIGETEQASLAESLNTTPTGWWWYYGVTPAQLSSIVNSTGGRIVSLQVEQASPLLFTVALVSNTGSYAKSWWYYYGLTANQLSTNITNLNARIASLDAYEINGTTYFAAVLISNTGADAKAWWWYYGVTPAQISSLVTQNSARLVDLRSYVTSGVTRYAAVMISNTGADAMSWWWYYNVTPNQIGSLLSQNNAFLISIEPADASGSTFNVVMEQNQGIYWWWYYGMTAADLSDRLSQNGARLLDVKTYFVNGSRRFAAVMVNNSNAATTRVGNILRSGTDGETGLYLKQVNGNVQASLQANRVFEPASSIKILIALHAMRQVDAGLASLNQSVVVYAAPASGSCPTNTIIGTETMSNAILQMLESSDNERTKAMIDTFGFAAINQTASDVGLSGTQLNHYPGCGGPPANEFTLADAGKIYEGIATASLITASSRDALYARMPAQAGDFTGIASAVNAIIDAEAPGYGLTAAEISQFKSATKTHYKAGGYTLCPSSPCLEYRSVAGDAEIPMCTRGLVGNRNYVWGIFIDGATSAAAANNTFNAAKAEPLREPLRSSLSTWGACF